MLINFVFCLKLDVMFDSKHYFLLVIFYRNSVCWTKVLCISEPSSPFRHMTELHQLIQSAPSATSKPILFVYTDGGPDHRITFISVQLSLIFPFLKLNLDYLYACRTALYHSWHNPVEHILSVLNLCLQCVGLATG